MERKMRCINFWGSLFSVSFEAWQAMVTKQMRMSDTSAFLLSKFVFHFISTGHELLYTISHFFRQKVLPVSLFSTHLSSLVLTDTTCPCLVTCRIKCRVSWNGHARTMWPRETTKSLSLWRHAHVLSRHFTRISVKHESWIMNHCYFFIEYTHSPSFQYFGYCGKSDVCYDTNDIVMP